MSGRTQEEIETEAIHDQLHRMAWRLKTYRIELQLHGIHGPLNDRLVEEFHRAMLYDGWERRFKSSTGAG